MQKKSNFKDGNNRGGTLNKRPNGDVPPALVGISLLQYEVPLIKCKIWCISGSIFQIFQGSDLRKF